MSKWIWRGWSHALVQRIRGNNKKKERWNNEREERERERECVCELEREKRETEKKWPAIKVCRY